MRNAFNPTALGSTGIQYTVGDSLSLPADGVVRIRRFDDGSVSYTDSEVLFTQSTEVPAPAGIALPGLGLLLAARRRRA